MRNTMKLGLLSRRVGVLLLAATVLGITMGVARGAHARVIDFGDAPTDHGRYYPTNGAYHGLNFYYPARWSDGSNRGQDSLSILGDIYSEGNGSNQITTMVIRGWSGSSDTTFTLNLAYLSGNGFDAPVDVVVNGYKTYYNGTPGVTPDYTMTLENVSANSPGPNKHDFAFNWVGVDTLDITACVPGHDGGINNMAIFSIANLEIDDPVPAVSEPVTLVLASLGLFGVGLAGRRIKR